MSLQKQFKDEMIIAMKSKDSEKLSLIRVIIGELNTNEKRPDALKINEQEIIRKMSNNAKEMGNQYEIDFLSTYLPTMLEPKQLETLVVGIITKGKYSGMQDMGKVMGELKVNHSGTYDGKLASQIVRDNL